MYCTRRGIVVKETLMFCLDLPSKINGIFCAHHYSTQSGYLTWMGYFWLFALCIPFTFPQSERDVLLAIFHIFTLCGTFRRLLYVPAAGMWGYWQTWNRSIRLIVIILTHAHAGYRHNWCNRASEIFLSHLLLLQTTISPDSVPIHKLYDITHAFARLNGPLKWWPETSPTLLGRVIKTALNHLLSSSLSLSALTEPTTKTPTFHSVNGSYILLLDNNNNVVNLGIPNEQKPRTASTSRHNR